MVIVTTVGMTVIASRWGEGNVGYSGGGTLFMGLPLVASVT